MAVSPTREQIFCSKRFAVLKVAGLSELVSLLIKTSLKLWTYSSLLESARHSKLYRRNEKFKAEIVLG